MIRKNLRAYPLVVFLIVFSQFLSACASPGLPLQSSQTPLVVPAITESQPVMIPTPVASPIESPAPVSIAGACSIQNELQALRPNVGPDWSQLQQLPCYDLTLDLSNASSGRFTGAETLTYTNTTPSSLSDFVFRLYPNSPLLFGGSLHVTSASVNGTPVSTKELLPDQTAIRLALPSPLEPGAVVTVHLAFDGQAPSNFGSSKTYGIFNLATSIPVLTLANWYPILADLQDGQWQAAAVVEVGDAVTSQSALFTVQVTAPSGWKLATTGVSAAPPSQAQSNISTFVSGPVRDFMIVASPKFEPETVTWQGIEIVHWRLAGVAYDHTALDVAQKSIQLYDQRFGPYPFTQIDLVDVPLQNASGVEYPGLVLIQNSLYANSHEQDFLQVVIAHELAHQWWYSVVGNNVRSAPWQDEALATFSSFLYFQQYNPGYYQGMTASFEQQVQSYEQNHTHNAVDQPVTAFENNLGGYSVLVYEKGGLFFVALRDQIGDQAFFDALHTYYENNMYQLVPPEKLLSAFERGCDCDLSSFYKQWGVLP